MAAELVSSATNEKMTEMDWTRSIEICEIVTRDPRQAKDIIKAIKKRLGHKNSNTQLFTVMLLEMLMNNVGEHIHSHVIDLGILPILVKIVKKKSNFPVRERIFLLLDATQTSFGGASGKYPQYYTAFYDLVSAGVQFPQGTRAITSNCLNSGSDDRNSASDSVTKSNSTGTELTSSRHEGAQTKSQTESSIIQKASNSLEVLREVLDTATIQNEVAKDEFTLDLVEQCSFQKQRVMQLALKSRDEKVVYRAIELNEELQKVLERHDALLSSRSTLDANNFNVEDTEDEEEEEVEQLFRRIRKGKASVVPESEESSKERPTVDMLQRPVMRPLRLEPRHESEARASSVAIPPPPGKPMEREKFFQETKGDVTALNGHVRGLSLHSRNTSSSDGRSFDSN